jgi:hypothetical protein
LASAGSAGLADPAAASNCTAAQLDKVNRAVRYFSNRVTDGRLDLADCLNASRLWGVSSYSGLPIATALSQYELSQFSCACNGAGATFEQGIRIQQKTLIADPAFIESNSVMTIAGSIAHAALHALGYQHGTVAGDSNFANSVPVQGQACITSWHSNAVVARGFDLWCHGAFVLNDPTMTFTDAAAGCQLVQQQLQDELACECFFDGTPIGYELFYGGEGPEFRVGYQPTWSRDDAVSNCTWNRLTYTDRDVECRFNGRRVGYELYYNAMRLGRETTWSLDEGRDNCIFNQQNADSSWKIQCYHDSRAIGYERYLDGQRVEYKSASSRDDAVKDCQANVEAHPDGLIDCRFEGDPL